MFFREPFFAENTQADSLMNLFTQATTPQERMYRCLNLDNYHRNILNKKQVKFTHILLNEGIKAKDEYIITDALRKLVMDVNRKNRRLTNDTVIKYLEIAEKNLTGQWRKSFITEVHLMHIRSMANWITDENKIISELTAPYTNIEKNENDIYYQIEYNYALGMSASLTISEIDKDSYKKALRYFDSLVDLLQKIPIEYRAQIFFWVNEDIYLAKVNAGADAKAVSFLELMMDVLKQYKALPYVKKDIYQTFEYVYTLYYEGIAHYPNIVGKKKAFECLSKADEIFRKNGSLLYLYYAYQGFYKGLGDKKNQIIYGDSIIQAVSDSIFNSTNGCIASTYKEQALCYADLKDYKNAYERFQKYDSLNAQLINHESKKLRLDMDARYDLNRLELEKERLISRNRQIALIFFGIIFFLSIVWGITQRLHLNKLKRMQKKLLESNKEVIRQSIKAQESENMKTAFINSMCHEIRTPLNAINGFSDLLLDKSLDEESKKEFPEHIRLNTYQLTQMVNDLLEIANLSSSSEDIRTEDVDIRAICKLEIEKLTSLEQKKDIKYELELGDVPDVIKTHSFYLSKVIENILNNANKFTERGLISLSCNKESDNKLIISITDTGIGIPADKHEWVFERFTKIDEFKQGTGLGLYVCRLIMERLGGRIYIDNEYTNGIRFIIELPL